MSVSGRILAAELFLLALVVYHDGWNWNREEYAGRLLRAHREIDAEQFV